MKQTALKDKKRSTAIIDAIGMTWYQVGIVSKELREIGWRTNVFPWVTAADTSQAAFWVHSRQSPKVWSVVESVITGQTITVTGVKISESGTVRLTSCMNYKSHIIAIFVIVAMAAQVS